MFIYIYMYIYIYKFASKCHSQTIRLPHPWSGGSQTQETFLAPYIYPIYIYIYMYIYIYSMLTATCKQQRC